MRGRIRMVIEILFPKERFLITIGAERNLKKY
jgi:hypothetical protein